MKPVIIVDYLVERNVAKSYEGRWGVDHFQHSLLDSFQYKVIFTHNMFEYFFKREAPLATSLLIDDEKRFHNGFVFYIAISSYKQ